MKLLRQIPAIAISVALSLWSCQDPVTGTSDEHETNIARLYRPGGAPASQARIKFYSVRDTGRTPLVQLYADDHGAFEVPTLSAGFYNAVASDGYGNAIVIDSILFTGGANTSMPSDTLRPMGILTGRLEVDPRHSPRIAWVQVMGVGLATNVDSLGNFRMDVPAGRVTLAALTRIPEYTPTFRITKVIPDSTIDLGTIRLEYTGIPSVTGLRVRYDDATGIVSVAWNPVQSGVVEGYRLEGVGAGEPVYLRDTFFQDTLFVPGTFVVDSKTRAYSVVVRDTNGAIGESWKWVQVVAKSPFSVARLPVRWDSLGRMPEGCGDLDTLDGGFVCLQRWIGGGSANWAYDGMTDKQGADSLRVWTSRDGQSWRLEPGIWKDIMRAVLWRGRLWVIQGGDSIGVRTETVPGLTQEVFSYQLYGAGILSSWSVRGEQVGIDTIRPIQPAAGFRIAVGEDALLLSADSSYLGAPGAFPLGLWPVSKEVWRKPEPSADRTGSLSTEFPWDFSRTHKYWMASFEGDRFGSDSFDDKSSELADGLSVWMSERGNVFLKRSGDRFAWMDVQRKAFLKYRGNGEVVPNGLPYQGGRIFFDENGGIWKLSVQP